MMRLSSLSRVLALVSAVIAALTVLVAFSGDAFAAPTDTCPNNTAITTLPYSESNVSTVGRANDIASVPLACNQRFTQVAGNDVVYALQVKQSSSFTITVSPSAGYDPSIYLLSSCAANTCTSGRGADENLTGEAEVLTFSNLTPGTYYLVVDSFYPTTDGRAAGTFDLSITGTLGTEASTTTLTSSANPSAYGQSVTFTANVSAASGAPAGSVTFVIDGTAAGTATLAGGAATFTTSSLAPGSHSVVAQYAGGSGVSPSSSAALTQVVSVASSATALVSSANPSTFGSSVTFTATVTSPFGTPTGTVTFTIDGAAAGTVALAGGSAALSTSALTAGAHTVTATYSGNASVAASASAPLTQQVNRATSSVALAASSGGSPVTFGTPVTFTATVASPAGTPTGTVTFVIDGVAGTPVALAGGQAAITTSTLAVGAHTIRADYSGSAGIAPSSSAVLNQTVTAITTTTTVASSGSPSSAGQSVTFTATVAAASGTAAGSVVFAIDGAEQPAVALSAGGTATFTTSSLVPGVHTIAASYLGSATHAPSSGSTTQTVNKVATTITVTSTPANGVHLEPLVLKATVTPTTSPLGALGGEVELFDGATSLGKATLDANGAATLPVALRVGTHTITAKFPGNAIFASATSAAITVTIAKANTTTTLLSSANPGIAGHPVTFTAHVVAVGPGAGVPSGTVTFFDGATSIGSAALDASGDATLTLSTLAIGAHGITAQYAGSAEYVGSTSAELAQNIHATGLSIALVSSANPTPRGTNITFTATVTSLGFAATPTGDIAFASDGVTIGTTALGAGGTAAIATATLSGGTHTITATHQGDANFPAGTTTQLLQKIDGAVTTTSLTASPNPSTLGADVTFTATVSSAVSGAPTGSVVFRDGSSVLGTSDLGAGGVAAFSTSALTAGSHDVTAEYGGDTEFAPSTSAVVDQLVNTKPSNDGGVPPTDAGADSGNEPSTDGGASSDGGPSPSPSPSSDAGTELGLEGGGADGCGCRTVGGGPGSGVGALVGLALAAAFIRRRRR